MDISSHKQLFIDERFIDAQSGIRLCMNAPVQHPDPVLQPTSHWEDQGIGAYNTVWREADGRFRMWYDALWATGLPSAGARRLCYAESPDGIHWKKPELGLISFRGSRANNIVAPLDESQSMQGATVYRDERAPATERYKLWSKFLPSEAQMTAGVRPGLWAMHSEDGIHWSPYPDQPNPADVFCDTQNMFFWDERLQLYVGYTRARQTQGGEEAAAAGKARYRSIGRITSPDFKNWSDLAVVFEADDDDLAMPVPHQVDAQKPNIDFYTSCAMKYNGAENVYLMLPSAYHHWGENDFPATMDVQLLTSRDGIHWQRGGHRQPFLRQGLNDSAASGMLFANPWLIPMGDELWFYYSATARRHSSSTSEADDRSAAAKAGIFRASLRRDGFISADAGYGGGEFITPPLQFSGGHLELNCDGSAGGWLKVEIQAINGRPIPGFSLSDADPMLGNGLRQVATWKGKCDVSSLARRWIRLRLIMRDMKLYAFQFCDSD